MGFGFFFFFRETPPPQLKERPGGLRASQSPSPNSPRWIAQPETRVGHVTRRLLQRPGAEGGGEANSSSLKTLPVPSSRDESPVLGWAAGAWFWGHPLGRGVANFAAAVMADGGVSPVKRLDPKGREKKKNPFNNFLAKIV